MTIYNRYSYCWNNPCLRDAGRQALKFVDPSGYMVSGGYYAPDMNGVNSSLQWANNSYYTDLYGSHDFWNGGKYLTRMVNYGGGNGVVWDGANPENATVFLPGNLFDDGSRYVNSIVPSGMNGAALSVKYSANRLAESILNGTVGWNSETGFATVGLLQSQGLNYVTLNGFDFSQESNGEGRLRSFAEMMFTVEGAYSSLLHNHETYKTLGGKIKNIYKANGEVRSAYAQRFARTSKVLRFVGNFGGAFCTGLAYYDIYSGNDNSPIRLLDAGVGTTDLFFIARSRFGYSAVPIIGKDAAVYYFWRLAWELGAEYGPSTWYGNDDSKYFE